MISAPAGNNIYVPFADDVVGFFDPEGPMVRLDAATGEVLQTYDQGLSLVQGEYKSGGGEFSARMETSFGTIDTLHTHIMRQGSDVVQVYGGAVAKLDVASGNKKWHYQAPAGVARFATMDAAGDIYMLLIDDKDITFRGGAISFPGRALIRLNGADGTEGWRIDLDSHSYGGVTGRFFPREMSGPANDMIWVGGHFHDTSLTKIYRIGNTYSLFIDAQSGTITYENNKTDIRGKAFMLDDNVMLQHGAYNSTRLVDPRDGSVLASAGAYSQPGGCGLQTATPNFIIRGQMLLNRENIREAYVSTGFRPHCEAPMMPAYGALYSGQSGTCGCGWYLPMSYTKAGQHHQQPDVAQRVTAHGGVTTRATELPSGALSDIWPVTKHYVGGAKSERIAHTPQAIQKSVKRVVSNLTREDRETRWYGIGKAPFVNYKEAEFSVDVHHHRVTALLNDASTWTAVLDGRISTAPKLVGDVVVVATHAGALFGLDLATGQTRWRTLIAPNEQQLVAFGQLESLWPCFGVVMHEGLAITVAGRISQLGHWPVCSSGESS